jgi:hypothetical protein
LKHDRIQFFTFGFFFLQIESLEGEDDSKDRKGNGFFSIFDYDQTLIPPEPNFFTEGISLDLADK